MAIGCTSPEVGSPVPHTEHGGSHCDPGTWERKAGSSEVQGHPLWLHKILSQEQNKIVLTGSCGHVVQRNKAEDPAQGNNRAWEGINWI